MFQHLSNSTEQEQKIHRKCFTHERLAIYRSNDEKGISNEFTLDDIRGAAATIHIAGNDTVGSPGRAFS